MKTNKILTIIILPIVSGLLLISFIFNMVQLAGSSSKQQTIARQESSLRGKDIELEDNAERLKQCQSVAKKSEKFIIAINKILAGSSYTDPDITVDELKECYTTNKDKNSY